MAAEDKVRALIADHFQLDIATVCLSSFLHDDLGMDSLDFVELELEIEDEFNMAIPEGYEFDKTTRVIDVVAVVKRHGHRGVDMEVVL